MSVTLEQLVEREQLTSEQRAFVEKHILKGKKSLFGGAPKVTAEEQQGVRDYKAYVIERGLLIDIMKTLPLNTAGNINFTPQLVNADTTKDNGDVAGALAILRSLTNDARAAKKNCQLQYLQFDKRLAGLNDPEGVMDDVLQRGQALRQAAQNALLATQTNRYDFTDADRQITALEDLYGSAPKLKALQDHDAAVAKEAKDALARLDALAKDASASETDRKKAALGKKLLTEAIAHGPLSGESGRKLDAASAKIFIKAFEAEPELAKSALKVAAGAEHPAAVAKGLEVLTPLVQARFPNAEGNRVPEGPARAYANALLRMSGQLGDDYVDRMPAYMAGKHFGAKQPMGSTERKTPEQMAQQRSLHLASKLMKKGGELDVASGDAEIAIGHALFHIDSFKVETAGLNANLLETLPALKDARATDALKALKAPDGPCAQGLIRKALGKADDGELDADASRQAVLAAMLKPLHQGRVGSCFATAPVRQMRQTQPVEAIKALGEIATTGAYQPPHGAKVPAVTNIPEGDDPLQRSWEYSLATSAARDGSSIERKKFTAELMKPVDGLNSMLSGDEQEKETQLTKLRAELSQAFTLSYDATADIGSVSRDGSSKQGHFVPSYDGKPIKSYQEFKAAIGNAVKKSLGIDDPTSDRAVALDEALEHELLVLNRRSDFKPWDIPSGGTDAATIALFGAERAKATLFGDDLSDDRAKRTTELITSLTKTFSGTGADMIGLGVSGVHAFNGLPNHPSLKALKGDEGADQSDDAVKQRVKTHLLDKGKAIADTALSAERATWLFDQQLEEMIAGEPDVALQDILKDIAKTKRPKAALKPAALNTTLADALKPYFDEAKKGKTPATSAVAMESNLKNRLVRELGVPEFVIADTNWGDTTYKMLFVVAPDPLSGEPMLWRKKEPPGSLSPAGTNFFEKGWYKEGGRDG